MNDLDRRTLELLQQHQQLLLAKIEQLSEEAERCREQAELLGASMEQIGTRLKAEAGMMAEPVASQLPVAVLPIPAQAALVGSGESLLQTKRAAHCPPPLPITPEPEPIVPPVPVETKVVLGAPVALVFETSKTFPIKPDVVKTESVAGEKPSFELRLGTFWLVRAGIVMVLSALGWAGYYAYDKYHLGAGAKVAMLYLVSGLLLGAGAWLQRQRERETVRNFGQVVFAGGLAAVYFVTYAAHYISNLRIINSELVDGALLLGWAGFIVWLADRKKSEVMALFAIGLAYYTSAITNIGLFTLYSNLVLTVAAVFFLLRNRWAMLSLASLAATYGGFVYWRFYNDGWFWDLHPDELNTANLFLAGYWIVFTVAGFLSTAEYLVERRRATFLSLNNGAYFALAVLSMLHVSRGNFPNFALGYGLLLIGLSVLAGRVHQKESIVRHAYLTQGLLLLTVGLIAKFSGFQLALILAAESVALLVMGDLLKSSILRVGAYLSALLAAGWGLWALGSSHQSTWLTGASIGAMLVVNAVWSQRRVQPGTEVLVSLRQGYFAALGLLLWLVTTWKYAPTPWLVPILAIEALLLTVSCHVLKVREISFLAQIFLIIAQGYWLQGQLDIATVSPWWNPALLILMTLATTHWWQWQSKIQLKTKDVRMLEGLYALAIVGILFFWLQPQTAPSNWLAYSSLLALGITAYGLVTRLWILAGSGQIFMVVSGFEFVRQVWNCESKPEWYLALVPVASLLIVGFIVVRWVAQKPSPRESFVSELSITGIVYRWLALLMSLGWVFAYIPDREQMWVLAVVATALFLVAGWWKNQEAILASGVWFGASALTFVFAPERSVDCVYWPNLLAILLLPILQRVARRWPERFAFDVHAAMLIPGLLLLWLFLTRWIIPMSDGLYLTLTWSILAAALVVAEVGFRERLYHWLSLGFLALALGHVALSDVWKPDTFWLNLLPMLLTLGLQQLSRRVPGHYPLSPDWQTTMILVGGTGLWLFLSRWVMVASGGRFLITVTWAGLALVIFTTGFLLHERIYRWLGLGILACAIGRVCVFDVWALEPFYRILSFLALGCALLAVGFLYTKYQDRIKQWL